MYQKLYILGQPYEVVGPEDVNNPTKLEGVDGLAELYAKKLVVDLGAMGNPQNYENEEGYYMRVLRHEMVHAFMHECGLSNYAKDEQLTEFLAQQLDKMWEIMNPDSLRGYLKGLGFYSKLKEEQ